MPLYEFQCDDCNTVTEALFSVSKKPNGIVCPKCNGVAENKVATGNFIVNGANAANRYSGDSNMRWIGFDENGRRK